MILKKPYAFFIKVFKPLHILFSIATVYLIYITNDILKFFNNYIYSNENVVGQILKEELVSKFLFIIPIIFIVFFLLFIGIMFYKKKPITFYIVNIFLLLIVLIINIYVSNFLGIMENAVVSIKLVKFNHDLTLINMLIEVILFVFLIIRGLGINFKKFNFDSDISNFNVNELDREEFELNVNIDLDEAKRNRKRKLRQLKYFYKENRFLINLSIFAFFLITIIISVILIINSKKTYVEGVQYHFNKFDLMIENSFFIYEDFNGKKITDDCLVAIEVSLNSNFNGINLFNKDFYLHIGEAIFPVSNNFNNKLIDIGNVYKEEILTMEKTNYLFIFEIPEKYEKSDMFLIYNEEGINKKIKIEPSKYETISEKKAVNLNETLSFDNVLGNINFKISSFSVAPKFVIEYNYCLSADYCIPSKEYIKPTINENFDKSVLKLELTYDNKSDLNYNSFYDFFSNFAILQYKKGGIWYSQTGKFELLKSTRIKNNSIYIGINSEIENAEEIKIVFNLRNSKYEYILK